MFQSRNSTLSEHVPNIAELYVHPSRSVRHSCRIIIFILFHQIVFFVGALRHYRPTTRPATNSHSPMNFTLSVIFPTLSTLQSHTSTLNSDFFKLIPNLFDNTWPPLDKQMVTHNSHRTSILLPPPNLVQSLHSTAPDHWRSRSQPRPVIIS